MLKTIAAFDRIGEENAFAVLAHAMQLGVESISAAADEMDGRTAPSSRAASALKTSPRSVLLVISFVDASGNRSQLECTTAADRISTDSPFLNLEDVRAAVSELSKLSDHELSDIGIGRGDIEHVARRPVASKASA